ncbi:MAG: glutamyl-tRNA reductase [Verrucomicrobiota bacterium]
MELVCLGLNHTTAPVEVREQFAVAVPQLGEASRELLALDPLQESLVLSTCNRTEYYFASENGARAAEVLKNHLAQRVDASGHFYHLARSAAAEHLCRVVSGLDSMMLGETEIFGQVKQAYQAALSAGTTGGVLNRVFQRAFSIGKKVRTETSIQEGSTSVGSVAVDLAEKIFGHLADSEVMILGAGEMSRVTAQNLVSRGARSIIVSNRTHERAIALAAEMGGTAIRFDNWLAALQRVDVVISSTGSPRAIIHREDVERVRRARKFRPLFFIDIAVPRDIDPAVGGIPEVYLYDIDTLEQLAGEARTNRQRQVEQCERMISAELAKSPLPGI